MRRLFWLSMGVTLGVLVFRKMQETAAALRPQALAQRTGRGAADIGEQARRFAADVRSAMRQREHELREGVGLDVEPGATTGEI